MYVLPLVDRRVLTHSNSDSALYLLSQINCKFSPNCSPFLDSEARFFNHNTHSMYTMRLEGGSHLCWAQSLSHVRLCNLMDCSLPGSSVHGIFQARILEWVVISFSGGSSPPRDRTRVSCTAGRFSYHCVTWEVGGNISEGNKPLLSCCFVTV